MVNKRRNIPLKIDIIAHILFIIVPLFFIHVLDFNSDFASGNERLGVILSTSAIYLTYMVFFVFFCGFTQKNVLFQYLIRYFAVMYTSLSVLHNGLLATFIHGLCVLLSMFLSIFGKCKETDKKEKKAFILLLIFYIASTIVSVFFFAFLRNNDHIAYSWELLIRANIVVGFVGLVFGLILYLCERKSKVWFYSMAVVNPCPMAMAITSFIGILIAKMICKIFLKHRQ